MESSKSNKKEKVNCCGCRDELEARHGGLSCPQGHHLCLKGCANSYINVILGDPLNNLPPRCPDCRAEYSINVVERVLTAEQAAQFGDRMFEVVFAKQCCASDEVLCQCPFCNYSEYRQIANNERPMFVYCRRPGCEKRSCATCKMDVTDMSESLEDERSDDEDEEEEEENGGGDREANRSTLSYHMKCAELADVKEQFEKALGISVGVSCPQCGLVGRKDDACNHMSCTNCETDWCYMCGKKQADLDGAHVSVYGHFDGWKTNANRCPMYLYEIVDVDEEWPDVGEGEDGGERTLDFFHRRLTLRALNRFYTKIGDDKWRALSGHFDSVKNCGFELSQFVNVSHDEPLFVREPEE